MNPEGHVIGSLHINEPSHAAQSLLSVLSKLGVVIPLSPLSGYSITIIAADLSLSHPVLGLVFSPGEFNVMVSELASSCPLHYTIQMETVATMVCHVTRYSNVVPSSFHIRRERPPI